MQLQVGGGACCLIHGSYNIRALGIFCIQEAVEHFSKGSCMMEVIQYDHRGKVWCIIFTLFCYVGKILTQFFAAFMVHTGTQYGEKGSATQHRVPLQSSSPHHAQFLFPIYDAWTKSIRTELSSLIQYITLQWDFPQQFWTCSCTFPISKTWLQPLNSTQLLQVNSRECVIHTPQTWTHVTFPSSPKLRAPSKVKNLKIWSDQN